ncbi:MAG: hypothetical protein KJ056_10500 [Acidimicrobiia bacterium]|nr:hypothetical protein [Acidimicrobiia bacterium]
MIDPRPSPVIPGAVEWDTGGNVVLRGYPWRPAHRRGEVIVPARPACVQILSGIGLAHAAYQESGPLRDVARACEAAAEWLDAETRSEAEWQEETR